MERYLASHSGGRKRVWAEHTAWGAIALLSGEQAPWLGQVQRSRLRSALRQVTETGVRHVMRLFTQHMLGSGISPTAIPAATPAVASQAIGDVVCDEETIEHSLRAAAGL